MSQINFTQLAADQLSNSFSRVETIEELIEKGCPAQKAESITNSLIKQSQMEGWKEVGLGIILLPSLFILPQFVGISPRWYYLVPGFVFLSDGIRRLGSLAMYNEVSIFPWKYKS